MIISADNVTQGYSSKVVIDDMSFEANTGEILSILGPNGAGKSTLIKTICNFHKPISGTISIDSQPVDEIDRKDLAKIIGYVPQNYTNMQQMSVIDTVLLGRKPYVEWSYSKSDFDIAQECMTKMRVLDLATKNIRELSGGQMQRVFIARALTQKPRFYMFDEPTSSLDLKHQINVMKLMKSTVKDEDTGVIIAVHDLNLALRYSDKVLMIKDKKIYDIGKPADVITEQAIMDVYGVKAKIIDTEDGPFILSIDSVE